jgi:hypothetical protein
VGVDRQRGLALAHADADEGRLQSIPLNAEGKRVGLAWDPARDEMLGLQCKSYFTEPLVRSQNWFLDPGQQVPQFYCEYVTELPSVTADSVPHYLPGTNPNLTEMAGWYGLPHEVLRGGADKMLPEYRKKMPKPETPAPAICERMCNCSDFRSCL